MRLPDDYSHYHFILWKKNYNAIRFNMMFVSFEFLEQDYDYILCMKFDHPLDNFDPDIFRMTKSLENIFISGKNTFVILTQRKSAPIYQVSADEYIYSFSCNFQHFKKLIEGQSLEQRLSKNLLFELLNYIGNGRSSLDQIIVRQIPFDTQELTTASHCDVIIPHRGKIPYLRTLMRFLSNINDLNIFVGIDQRTSGQDLGFRNNYSNVSFYSFTRSPNGPYVLRNWLVNQGQSNFVFFQDSDDIPCVDRFQRLSAHMLEHDIPLCGSHEIKLDYFNKTVQAVRYPIDVNFALKHGPVHALLHPSSAILREEFYRCKRLSEDKIFANDTKFLYHAYFELNKIRNIDEFLYIRRSHPGSLTTSPNTCIGSISRTYLRNMWVIDFTLVKLGLLELKASSLNYEPAKRNFQVNKI